MNIDPTALSVAAALLALCAALLFALRAREAEREAAHERRLRAIADKALELAEREIEALTQERDVAREAVDNLSALVTGDAK
jgi:hypothetical protein